MFDSTPFVVMQTGVPIYLCGPAGSGKTTSIELIAKKLGRRCYSAIVHQGDPIEVTGLPYIDVKEGVMKYTPPEWVQIANSEPSIIFFDEASGLDESYQLRMLTILSHRRVGAYKIPDHTWFVLAGNPVESGTNASLFSIPFITRVCYFDWQPDDDRWMAHMITPEMSFDVDVPNIPKISAEDWNRYLPEIGGYISGFLKTSRQFVTFAAKDIKGMTNQPVPTRRSWDLARRALAGAKAAGIYKENILRIASGCVGKQAAGAFCEYLEQLDLPDIKDLIKKAAKGIKVLKGYRLDQLYIIVGSACAAIDIGNEEECRGVFNIIEELYNNGHGEFSALMIQLLHRRNPDLVLPPSIVSLVMPLATKLRSTMQ